MRRKEMTGKEEEKRDKWEDIQRNQENEDFYTTAGSGAVGPTPPETLVNEHDILIINELEC